MVLHKFKIPRAILTYEDNHREAILRWNIHQKGKINLPPKMNSYDRKLYFQGGTGKLLLDFLGKYDYFDNVNVWLETDVPLFNLNDANTYSRTNYLHSDRTVHIKKIVYGDKVYIGA